MSKKDLSLGKYGISQDRYRELKYFCLQYDKWKQEQTSPETVIRDLAIKKLALIEQTAIETASELYPYILQSVTQDIPYEYLDAPCEKRKFNDIKKRFFICLSEKR